MSKNIALIACDNGFGHVRRMMSLSISLSKLGAQTTLFAPASAVRKLAELNDVAVPNVVDFSCGISAKRWLDGGVRDWLTELPSLDKFDNVVCDNLIEILGLRPDAVLSGTFLWHKAIHGCKPSIFEHSEALLKKHHPKILATSLFTPEYLSQFANIYPVGLYRLSQLHFESPKNDVLISCGKGGQVSDKISTLLKSIASTGPSIFSTIWIEPSLINFNPPKWMQPADFSPKMYSQIAAAIIRPGIGTTTDVLLAGGRIFTYYEDGNAEMIENSSRLEKAGLGVNCKSPEKCWSEAVAFKKSSEQQLAHKNSLLALDKKGADSAAKLVLNL